MKFSELPVGSLFIWEERYGVKIIETLWAPKPCKELKANALFCTNGRWTPTHFTADTEVLPVNKVVGYD